MHRTVRTVLWGMAPAVIIIGLAFLALGLERTDTTSQSNTLSGTVEAVEGNVAVVRAGTELSKFGIKPGSLVRVDMGGVLVEPNSSVSFDVTRLANKGLLKADPGSIVMINLDKISLQAHKEKHHRPPSCDKHPEKHADKKHCRGAS